MKLQPFLFNAWLKLVGSAAEFKLTTRVFHSICIIILVALTYNVPFNYYVGLYYIALLSAVSLLIFVLVYYLSRVKRQNSLALLVFCITGNVLFIINFFLNSGINGPTDIFFILTVVIMVAVVPVGRYWLIVGVNLAIVLTLHYLQYTKPELVPYTYDNNQNRYFDISSAYVIVVSMILVNFYFIRKNYDIERKSAEQKAAVMKLLNEEKNKLFSIISHDLRAPLTNVQNYLELLTHVDMSFDEQQEIKNKLLDSTRYTLEMLNNVLSWSKNQMSGLTFSLSALCVHELLMPQLLLFKNIASNKAIKIEVSIDHDIRVLGNGEMLQLVVRNLINNAIKFTAHGGRIIFSAKQQGGSCLLMIKDSGTGNPIKLSPDMFYLNGESTRGTANEKGVGLGLVLCKEFTEAQQGRIWFECDSVSGVTFFVEMPLYQNKTKLSLNTVLN